MYKLTVVSGPGKGATYPLNDGMNRLGRLAGNEIILSSSRVSKRHCIIDVNTSGIWLKDEGSANGTFVNGTLTREKRLSVGDKVGLGDFVLKLEEFRAVGLGEVQFPSAQPSFQSSSPLRESNVIEPTVDAGGEAGLKAKAVNFVEKIVLPRIYGWAMKSEWRSVFGILFGAAVVGSVVLSVQPLIEANKDVVLSEMRRRAILIARDTVDRNAQAVATGVESKAEIGVLGKDPSVKTVVLVDLKGRIIAPSERANSVLSGGAEAKISQLMGRTYEEGKSDQGNAWVGASGLVIAVEPLKVFDTRQAKNVVRAMAVVSIDASLATPDTGAMGMMYSQALITSGILGLILGFLIYRATLKPLEVLNDDLDRVLRGEIPQVTHEFKWSEINALFDVINSAVQRIPRSGGVDPSHTAVQGPEDVVQAVRAVCSELPSGFCVTDAEGRVHFINSYFEEVTGIRSDSSNGIDLVSQARDQAFGSLISDLQAQAKAGGHGSEEIEFSGVSYQITAATVGAPVPRAVLWSLQRKGE